MRTALACALDGPLDLRRLERAALDEPGRLARGQPFDPLGERVQLVGAPQATYSRGLATSLRGVALRERRRQVERRRQIRTDGRELGRRRFDAHDAQRDVGTIGQLVDRAARRTGCPGQARPKLLRRVAAAVGKLDAAHEVEADGAARSAGRADRRARSSRSPRRRRRGFAVRPSRISIRSMRDPRRRSAGMTGKRSTGPTRRPCRSRPVNTRLTEARALSRTWGSRSTSSRFDRARRGRTRCDRRRRRRSRAWSG